MPKDYSFEKRRYIVGAMAVVIVLTYIVRLFTLQLLSDDYRRSADSNAFRKEIIYPSRGLIFDRNGKLLVYNEPSYTLLVTMQDQRGIDTLDFCRTLGITREEYIARMADIKDSKKHPGYSRNTPQIFMSQIPPEELHGCEKNCSASQVFRSRSAACVAIAQGAWLPMWWATWAR